MRITSHLSRVLEANSYAIIDDESRQFWIIDPAADMDKMLRDMMEKGLRLTKIINTHGHFDHVSGNQLCKDMWPDAEVIIHRDDNSYLSSPQLNLSEQFGFPIERSTATHLVAGGECLWLGNMKWQVLHTPGHTPGSVCLAGGLGIFTGDTLFCGSVGRCDFPGGSELQLAQSLGELAELCRSNPEMANISIFPGHGPSCSLLVALVSVGVDV